MSAGEKFLLVPWKPNLLSDTGLSGEETDDASENECYQNTEYSQFTEIKEQMYQVRIPVIQAILGN